MYGHFSRHIQECFSSFKICKLCSPRATQCSSLCNSSLSLFLSHSASLFIGTLSVPFTASWPWRSIGLIEFPSSASSTTPPLPDTPPHPHATPPSPLICSVKTEMSPVPLRRRVCGPLSPILIAISMERGGPRAGDGGWQPKT